MKLLQTWFSFRGPMRLFDFIIVGCAPGVVLGIGAMFLESSLDAHGAVIYPFLAFSLWPASAMLAKVAASLRRKNA
jgi:hypothetical protein